MYKYETKRKRLWRTRFIGKFVFGVGPNTWRVLWYGGFSTNFKENTLKYMV